MNSDVRSSKTSAKRGLSALAFVLMVFTMVASSFLPGGNTARAAQEYADWAPPSKVYFPETGQSLDRAFLDLWRGAGGQSSYGLPISPEITLSNGHVVQYLQYARFEYWPEGDANGNTIIVGKIGEELRPTVMQRSVIGSTSTSQSAASKEQDAMMRAWLPVNADAADPDANELYVEATQHVIKTGFLDFWYNTGDVWYLGNPLSEEYTLDGTIYQVFERGQLAYNEADGVHLVPVGETLAKKYGIDTKATAQGDIPTYSEDLFVPPPTPTPVVVAADGVTVPDEDADGYITNSDLQIADTNADGVVTQEEVAVPTTEALPTEGAVLPDVPSGEVWVDVSLSSQYMIVYQGNTPLLETYISSGRPGFDTPTGTFYVNSMLDSQTMEGVIGGEYYNVPDVPYVMYFTGEGHAIHGTYWHSNFGAVMSHGCLNMPMDAAAYLYSIAYIGMRVEIHY